jgi:hypothetical protein
MVSAEFALFCSSCKDGWASMHARVLRTDCGDGGDDFTKLQLVKNGGLSGGIETNHQNSHLLLAPQTVEQLGESKTHIGGGLWCEVGRCVEGRRKGPSLVSCAA